jgi:hypothetical protein
MEDILDENIDVENMWLFTPYRATALVAIRNLLIQSPPSNIVNDIISNVAGKNKIVIFDINCNTFIRVSGCSLVFIIDFKQRS